MFSIHTGLQFFASWSCCFILINIKGLFGSVLLFSFLKLFYKYVFENWFLEVNKKNMFGSSTFKNYFWEEKIKKLVLWVFTIVKEKFQIFTIVPLMKSLAFVCVFENRKSRSKTSFRCFRFPLFKNWILKQFFNAGDIKILIKQNFSFYNFWKLK